MVILRVAIFFAYVKKKESISLPRFLIVFSGVEEKRNERKCVGSDTIVYYV